MKTTFFYLLLGTGVVLTAALSLSVGAMKIPFPDILSILAQRIGFFTHRTVNDQYTSVLMIVRLPRVIMGVLVGGALGISGAAIQGVFRNPLAEPGLIGISSGASLFAVLIIALEISLLAGLSKLLGYYLLAFGAFTGAGLAAAIVYQISRSDGRPHVATMLLGGIAINAMAGALTGLFTYMANDQQLRNITFWLLGSLGGATWQIVLCLLPFVVIPFMFLPMMGKTLNAFALGEIQAEQLGMPVGRVKRWVVILSTMAVGASVAVTGIISFVGLLVPHMARLLFGVDNRRVLPASALMGASILTLADMLSRRLIAPVELPIGVITAILGTPVFLYILIKDKNKIIR
jgi:iron complex transport system permease protein